VAETTLLYLYTWCGERIRLIAVVLWLLLATGCLKTRCLTNVFLPVYALADSFVDCNNTDRPQSQQLNSSRCIAGGSFALLIKSLQQEVPFPKTCELNLHAKNFVFSFRSDCGNWLKQLHIHAW